MSLRRRLFGRILLPVAIVYLVLGFLGALQVRSTLIDNLDDDLILDSRNTAAFVGPLSSAELDDLFPATIENADTLFALVDIASGELFVTPSARFGEIDVPPADEDLAPQELVRRLDEPFTLQSSDGNLDYRAVAQRIDGGRLVIVAEPIDRIAQIFRRLLIAIVTTGLLVMAALAAVLYLTLRSGLRPIDGFIAATSRIADGDLSERIDLAETDPTFQRIGEATNHMLDQVEAGFDRQHIARQRLNQLITGVAHEMRTPLTGIRGTVDMHKMGMLTEPQALDTTFEQLDHYSHRMVEMVDDLLVIARAENTAIRHDETPGALELVDVGAAVSKEVRVTRIAHPGRSVELSIDEEMLQVTANDSQLSAAVRAVLNNAVQHTPKDAAIRVEVSRAADPQWAQIQISDTGPGMSVDIAEQVFDPFFRADVSRNRSTGGTGLGLTIARSSCEALGGFIEVRTEPGHGSTFVLSLPLAQVGAGA